jgi:hypothetical protein
MNTRSNLMWTLSVALLLGGVSLSAQEPTPGTDKTDTSVVIPTAPPKTATPSSAAVRKPTAPAHVAILKDAKVHTGMLTVYQKGSKLYAEFSGSDYSSEYIVLISIARGIGRNPILGGYSWSDGDDWVWTFRKIDDRVHIIRKNVRFKAKAGYPEQIAVGNAFTDSVMFSLRILTKGPKGGDLVDLTPVFMSDLPQISRALPGFGFSSDRSTWAKVKSFPKNLELEVAATYSSSGRSNLETVADSRAATIHVHYSISKLQSSGYVPRMADDRVGYFMTVQKDYNKKSDRDQFVRYINRWNLQKAPGATTAPFQPKKPIIFYIEKTVPHAYRSAIRAGIEEWNTAFATAGWVNAVEVRQQLDSDDWDPEDIRYNTFRWITASAGFAMGPSRVNPRTGEILDADIIFDADFLQFWKEEFETLTPAQVAGMTGGPLEAAKVEPNSGATMLGIHQPACLLNRGMARQLAFGASAILAKVDPKVAAAQQRKLIMQGLKETAMHEVGHTLGLRHNFKASKMMDLKKMNETTGQPIVASVMDYNPTNIVPKDWKQGDYYTTKLGPYDHWAIEFGYKPLSGGTSGEVKELQKIASRSGDPQLQYATDEDTVISDPDPGSNVWDLGDDALEYAKMRVQVVNEIMATLLERTAKEGDDYTQTRRAFNLLLAQHGQAMSFAARNVGGIHTNRSHKGDKDAKPPYEMVDVKEQRASLELVLKEVFSDEAFNFPNELYPYLAKSNWRHWGTSSFTQKDFPLHSTIAMWQSRIMSQLLSSTVLNRMHDIELKTPADKDVLTTAELIERLNKAVFAELDTIKEGEFTNRKPAISSVRRNLQRDHLRRLSHLAMGQTFAPDDCQTIAFAELDSIAKQMLRVLEDNDKLDSYSHAHLLESASRIGKVLEAKLTLFSP